MTKQCTHDDILTGKLLHKKIRLDYVTMQLVCTKCNDTISISWAPEIIENMTLNKIEYLAPWSKLEIVN